MSHESEQMNRQLLDAGWSLRPLRGPVPIGVPARIPATVPGCVHTDLMSAGVIPDPYLDRNEDLVQWVGESDFGYRTEFDFLPSGEERVDLVFQSLDTVATVSLNDEILGSVRNQHRTHRFDVTGQLVAGSNRLDVEFTSALHAARDAEARIGARPVVGNPNPYNAIRKMACNFGWDWGPMLVTAGILEPVYLHRWSVARIASVVPLVSVDATTGQVEVRVELERTGTARDVQVRARLLGPAGTDVEDAVVTSGDRATLTLTVADVELWWPRGYGAQPLYDLEVSVLAADVEVANWQRSIGFRTVEVRQVPDEFGTSFSFHVNGQYVFVKGANWIPDDCFLPCVTPAAYERSLRDALDANLNLLRIWGGGIYESDVLYDFCDRHGLLVWQDFLFACAAYSEAEELWAEVEAEARENVARLASHPSLVFYNGSNENVEGYYHWGWKDQLATDADWGNGYYEKLLPQVLAEVDPSRAYAPSSPFNPVDPTQPRDPDHGSVHSWIAWNQRDYTAYRESVPRFVAEFGFQGPPNFATIARSIHDDPLAVDSAGMLAHQKAHDGNGKLYRGYADHLPEPQSFDDWHYTTQLNQARAITYGIEHFRSHSPRTAGTVLWQLNDCWPVTSWAAVDGDKRRKPLWHALRHVYADRLLTIQPRDAGLALIASNDTATRWAETIQVERITLAGKVLATAKLEVATEPRSTLTLHLDPELYTPDDHLDEVLVATSNHTRPAYWYFAADLDLALSPAHLDVDIDREPGRYLVHVTARTFVKDLVLSVDRLDPDAAVDDALVTLRPGERFTFTVRSERDLDPNDLRRRPVLQTVNGLRHSDPALS
jgi:beta-mannosidase